jgi:hypothetical protein
MNQSLANSFRGRARWKKWRVIGSGICIMVVYMNLGRIHWSIRMAEAVSLNWKWAWLVSLNVSLGYSFWRIYRRALDRNLPPLQTAWIAWDALMAFSFAIVTADIRPFFYVGTFLWIALDYFTRQYFFNKVCRKTSRPKRGDAGNKKALADSIDEQSLADDR